MEDFKNFIQEEFQRRLDKRFREVEDELLGDLTKPVEFKGILNNPDIKLMEKNDATDRPAGSS